RSGRRRYRNSPPVSGAGAPNLAVGARRARTCGGPPCESIPPSGSRQQFNRVVQRGVSFLRPAGTGCRDVRGGFSALLGWAFGPRKLMKNCHGDFIATHERPRDRQDWHGFPAHFAGNSLPVLSVPGSEPTPHGAFSTLSA